MGTDGGSKGSNQRDSKLIPIQVAEIRKGGKGGGCYICLKFNRLGINILESTITIFYKQNNNNNDMHLILCLKYLRTVEN